MDFSLYYSRSQISLQAPDIFNTDLRNKLSVGIVKFELIYMRARWVSPRSIRWTQINLLSGVINILMQLSSHIENFYRMTWIFESGESVLQENHEKDSIAYEIFSFVLSWIWYEMFFLGQYPRRKTGLIQKSTL